MSVKRRRRRSRVISAPWSGSWTAPVEALQSVAEIGPVVAASVRAFADEPRNRALVARLKEAGVKIESQAPEPTESPARWPERRSS